MFKWIVLFALLWATPSTAANVTCATRPPGDSSNACASTAFVHGATTGLGPGGSNGQIQYNNAGTFGGLTNGQAAAQIGVPVYNINTTGGVVCNGSTNVSSAFQTAINSAAAAGEAAYWTGTCVVSNISIPTGLKLFGAGPAASILLRPPSDINNYVLVGTGTKFQLSNFAINGNNGNETVGGSNIHLSGAGNFSISDLTLTQYYSSNASTFGVGIQCDSSVDKTNNTNSSLIGNTVTGLGVNTTLSGIILNGCSNILVQGNIVTGNIYAGIAVLSTTLPVPSTPVNFNDTITGNTTNSDGIGIDVAGFFSGYGIGNQPLWSNTSFVNENVTISNNIMQNNIVYGCLVQANLVIVSHNQITGNGKGATGLGGCAISSDFPTITGNEISFNGQYGLDMGGSQFGIVTGNTITGNVISSSCVTGCNSIGLNLGASNSLTIGENYIAGDGDSRGGWEIFGTAVDGAGAGQYFPWIGSGLTIKGVHIALGNPAMGGIFLGNGWQFGVTISDVDINNLANSATPFEILVGGPLLRMSGNRELNSSDNWTPQIASASTIVIPDDADTVNITGSATINNIYGFAQNHLLGGLREFTVSNSGNGGYTIGTTATCTSTGGTPATVTPGRANNGHIYGLVVNTPGSGASAMSCTASDQTCTAVPGAVTLSGGAVTAIGAGSGGSGCANPPAVVLSGLTCSAGDNPQVYANVSGGAVTSYGIAYGGSGCSGSGTAAILNGSGFAGTANLNGGTQDQIVNLTFSSTPTINSGTGNVFLAGGNYTAGATSPGLGLRSSGGNWAGTWRQ